MGKGKRTIIACLPVNYVSTHFKAQFPKVKDQIQKLHVHFSLTLFEFDLQLLEIVPKKV